MSQESRILSMIDFIWSQKCQQTNHDNTGVIIIACPECCPNGKDLLFIMIEFAAASAAKRVKLREAIERACSDLGGDSPCLTP